MKRIDIKAAAGRYSHIRVEAPWPWPVATRRQTRQRHKACIVLQKNGAAVHAKAAESLAAGRLEQAAQHQHEAARLHACMAARLADCTKGSAR